jgi:hypothetical protein
VAFRSSNELRKRAQDRRGEWINLSKLKGPTEQLGVGGALCAQGTLQDKCAVDLRLYLCGFTVGAYA